ncbi:hypothetical protein [Aeromonas veronii]|uniref:hypothetical protein n=1 Tax=Aeromonas veronii TaxID=654 RepID=UPI0030CACD19
MTGHNQISDAPLVGVCDFCGLVCEGLGRLTSDSNPDVVLLICPDCEREQSCGGYDVPEDYF